VHWRELGEVENECTSYNFWQFAIFVPKLPHLVEVWRCLFSETRCIAYLPGFLIDHPNGLAYATVLRLSVVVCTEYMYIMAG